MTNITKVYLAVDSTEVKSGTAELDKLQKSGMGATSVVGKLGRQLIGLGAGIITIQTVVTGLGKVIRNTSEFETALIGVAKTTGLADQQLSKLATNITNISKRIPVTTGELLELSQAAGQMGVTGVENLEKFSLVVAKLGRASDLAGSEAATSLARILNVTKEAVDSVDVLASVIVALGNNTAATESEIAHMTTEVARATTAFGVSSAKAAAMAAAMASVGIQAQLGGSSVGRAMQEITNRVQAGGSSLAEFADILQLDADTLTELFKNDKTKAFEYFLQNVGELGLDAGLALKDVNLGGQEIAKTIVPLANNMEIFAKTMALANAEVANATALDREFEATLGTLASQWQITKNIMEDYSKSIGNFLVPALNSALTAFNKWSSVAELSPVEKQIKLIADLQGELASELNNKNIPLLGDLIFDKRNADELSARIEFAIDDLAKLGPTFANIEKTSINVGEAVGGMSDSLGDLNGSVVVSVDLAGNFLEALRKEALQSGKTAVEIKKMEAAAFGLSKVADPLIDKIDAETKAAAKLADQLARVKSITESVRTVDEKFAATQDELNSLLDAGLGLESYNRALEQARKETEKLGDTTKNTTDQMQQIWIQATRNIQSSLANSIFNFFDDGLKGMVKNVISAVGRIASEFAALRLLQGVGGLFGLAGASTAFASVSGLSLFGGGSAAVAGGSTASLTSLIPTAVKTGVEAALETSLFNMFATSAVGGRLGLSTANAAGSIVAGNISPGSVAAGEASAAAATVTELGSSIGAGISTAGISIAASIIASLITNKELFGQSAGVVVGGASALGGLAAGAAMGSELGPIGAAVGAIVGLVSVLGFGLGPEKQRETKFSGSLSAQGLQDGEFDTRYRRQGGWFRKNKNRHEIQDASDEVNAQFEMTMLGIASSVGVLSDNLGLETNRILEFSKPFSITSANGAPISAEQINTLLEPISSEISQFLLPEVEALQRGDEDAFQTLSRLSFELSSLTEVATIFGNTIDESRAAILGSTFAERERMIQIAGGIDALNTKASFFADNFLTDAERLDIGSQKLTNVLTGLGVATDITKEDFKTLVQELGRAGGESFLLANSLLDVAPLLLNVRNATDQLAESSKAAAQSQLETLQQLSLVEVDTAFSSVQRSIDAERLSITKDFNTALNISNERIRDVGGSVNSLEAFSKSLGSTIASVSPMSLEAARAQIKLATTTKDFSSDDLKSAISILGSGGDGRFSSKLEEQQSRAKNITLLTALESTAASELTLDQRSLAALISSHDTLTTGFDGEMVRLDGLLSVAQTQINILNGINTSVVDVTTAIGNLQTKVGAATAATSASGGGGGGGSGTQSLEDVVQAAYWTTFNRAADDIGLAFWSNPANSFTQAGFAAGAQGSDIAARDAIKLQAFEHGGITPGGNVLVGETGAEVVNLPRGSQVHSNADSKRMTDNTETVAELRQLRKDINKLLKTIDTSTAASAEALDRVTAGGGFVRTKAAA